MTMSVKSGNMHDRLESADAMEQRYGSTLHAANAFVIHYNVGILSSERHRPLTPRPMLKELVFQPLQINEIWLTITDAS